MIRVNSLDVHPHVKQNGYDATHILTFHVPAYSRYAMYISYGIIDIIRCIIRNIDGVSEPAQTSTVESDDMADKLDCWHWNNVDNIRIFH